MYHAEGCKLLVLFLREGVFQVFHSDGTLWTFPANCSGRHREHLSEIGLMPYKALEWSAELK